MSESGAPILLAEDSSTQALQTGRMLEEAGHRVIHAADGARALALARTERPRLVVSDVLMPGLTGDELCAAIRREPALRDTPFVLLTAQDSVRDLLRGLQADADRYLIKPPDRDLLVRTVDELLRDAAQPGWRATSEGDALDYDGQVWAIPASRRRMLILLLHAYDNMARARRELLSAQGALRTHEAELEQTVRRRTAELTRANAELRDAVRNLEEQESARRTFIENVSHELRTPLATMSYAVGNLLKGLRGPLPPAVRDYLAMFDQDCARMKATVADILDFQRAGDDALVLHRMKLAFPRHVGRTVAKLAPAAEAKGIALAAPALDAQGFVDADPLKIERAVANVVQNAIQFTPEGGRVEVAVARAADGAAVELIVTDNGPGIAPEHLPHVTEPYYRVGEFVSGTGLGLTVAREIVERHGGTLAIASPPSGRAAGTEVRIRLPLAAAPRVLAVDDSRTIQMVLEKQLATFGYAPVTCGSAEEALELLPRLKPDLLVSDSVLPGMEGVELVVRVKSNPAFRYLPIVMITGAEVDRPKREVLEDLRVPLLAKPWRMEELVTCLEDAVYGKHYLER